MSVHYMAEIDGQGLVLRVIVANDPAWPAANLGGEWVETSDPYGPPSTVAYCGPGYGYAQGHPQRFAPVAPPGLEKANPDDPDAFPPSTLFWDVGSIANVEEIARRRGVLTAQEAVAKAPVKPGKP